MHYRNMEISDYRSCLALWQASAGVSLRDADSTEGIAKYLRRNPGLSFVALKAGNIVGTIMAGHDGKRGYIQHLAVSEQAQKSGIASELVSLCLAALKTQGIVKTHVHVLRNNEIGQQFWLNRGWFERDEVTMFSFINAAEGNP